MKETADIEKLFKEKLEHFEADVNPNVWSNIGKSLNAATGSGGFAAGKIIIAKILAGIAAATVVVTGSIWYLSSDGEKNISLPEKKPAASVSNIQPVSLMKAGQQTPKNNSGKEVTKNHARRQLNSRSNTETADQGQEWTNANSDDPVIASDKPSPEGSEHPESKTAGKYGNATQGDPGMLRGNRTSNYSSPSGSPASSGDSPEENTEAPAVNIFANTFSGDAPLTVNFMSQSVASSLFWEFGDGTTSGESAPTHRFEKPGTYTVKLTAKNSSGSATDKVTIEVRSISGITDIPNIFTPNNDGENDIFFFDMENIASIGVTIINQRTGELVTRWNNLDGNWNGKLKDGNDAPAGVYLYSIEAIGIDGITHSEKGFVTIVR